MLTLFPDMYQISCNFDLFLLFFLFLTMIYGFVLNSNYLISNLQKLLYWKTNEVHTLVTFFKICIRFLDKFVQFLISSTL